MGGHATADALTAVPDCGGVTPTENDRASRSMAETIAIPVIADAGPGWRVRCGRVSVCRAAMSDPAWPAFTIETRSLPNTPPTTAAAVDVRHAGPDCAAVDGRSDPDFVIIVRDDELYVDGGGGSGCSTRRFARGVALCRGRSRTLSCLVRHRGTDSQIAAEVKDSVWRVRQLVPDAVQLVHRLGTAAAARSHYGCDLPLRARRAPPGGLRVPEKDVLINQGPYDSIVRTWRIGPTARSGERTESRAFRGPVAAPLGGNPQVEVTSRPPFRKHTCRG